MNLNSEYNEIRKEFQEKLDAEKLLELEVEKKSEHKLLAQFHVIVTYSLTNLSFFVQLKNQATSFLDR